MSREADVLLRGLQDERVAAGQGDRVGTMGGEVERGDPGDHAYRLPDRVRVDADETFSEKPPLRGMPQAKSTTSGALATSPTASEATLPLGG